MDGTRDRRFTYDAELLLQKRQNVKRDDFHRRIRAIRLCVYNFLDHPMSAKSTPYHFMVFLVVLITVVLGATTETIENHWMLDVYLVMEKMLLVFFSTEFCVRLWAVSANAKYMGFRGRLRYLSKIVSIIDIVIILVTLVMLILEKGLVSPNTMDYLRFVQILRLFHIDRQMTTWRLIKNMIIISRWELFSAYYITFILFLLMANLVFYSEHYKNPLGSAGNWTEGASDSFPTLAHACWFSVVSILTIGYGDIVPSFWVSKVIVCVLGFLAYCTFVTASTQISVGLTLMMEEDNKMEYKNKLRNTSASVIQCWWRYHLATQLMWDNNKRTSFFRHVCYKLYLTEERMNAVRQYERKVKDKRERKLRLPLSIVKRNSQPNIQALGENSWKSSLRLGVASQFIQPAGINAATVRKTSLLQRYASLPCRQEPPSASQPVPEPATTEEPRSAIDSRRQSFDTSSISSSFESEEQLNIMSSEKQDSEDISSVDEKLLMKYQPLLRFFMFLLFRLLSKKLQRLRKADKLLEIEAEITEQEHERDQKLRELEVRLNSLIGRPSHSLLDSSGEKHSVIKRVELCENKMEEMERKIDEISNMAESLIQILSNPTPSEVPHGLPPAPPGKRFGHRLRRQFSVVPAEADEEELDD